MIVFCNNVSPLPPPTLWLSSQIYFGAYEIRKLSVCSYSYRVKGRSPPQLKNRIKQTSKKTITYLPEKKELWANTPWLSPCWINHRIWFILWNALNEPYKMKDFTCHEEHLLIQRPQAKQLKHAWEETELASTLKPCLPGKLSSLSWPLYDFCLLF